MDLRFEESLGMVHKELRAGRPEWSTEHAAVYSHNSWVNPDIRIYTVNVHALISSSNDFENEVDELMGALKTKLLQEWK